MHLSDLLLKPPYSKFLLIEDSIEIRSNQLVDCLIRNRVANFKDVHWFVFEGRFAVRRRTDARSHDFCTDARAWLPGARAARPAALEAVVAGLSSAAVVFLDSLNRVIDEYGFERTYRWLNRLVQNKAVDVQIIAVFHRDLQHEEHVPRYLEHLATFVVALEPKVSSNNFRVVYTYKKSGGKIIRNLEEFWFENDDQLRSKPIDRLDSKVLNFLKKSTPEDDEKTVSERLTTFKIGLEDDEKKAREKLVLPFHPSYVPVVGNQRGVPSQGEFFYEFDANDDWDKEDPDDDLDI